MNQQHGIRFFREVHPPHLNFVGQNQVWMDVIQCCMMIGWTYLALSSFILFCFKPRMVSDKNNRRNIFTIIILVLFHKGITTEGKNSYYLPNVLVLGQELVLGKPSNCTQVGEVVSPPTSTFVYLSQDSHNEINICIYNHPFKVFMNKENEGVEDLVCGNVGETN